MPPSLKIKPMSGIASAITRLFTPPRNTIRGVETTEWFGPLQPVRPIAPEGTEPRGRQYYPGQNLIYTPRAERRYDAEKLRGLAAYPLARMAIENVCDIIVQKSVNIRLRKKPGESGKDYAKRKPDKGIIQVIADLLANPNPEQDRETFERQLLDDMLVGDWASVLIRKTVKGEIKELRAIDGSIITRYIDEQGFTPQNGDPAYAQLWYGIPMVDLSTDQLLYAARNVKTNELYGLSPTEQLAPEIEIGIERLAFTRNYYTTGNIADGIQVVPRGVDPTKVEMTQDLMNSSLAGNLAKRRQLRLIQGFTEKGEDKLYFPKDKELSDTYDDLHTRRIAFGYGISAQRLTKPMNRASAQANQQASEDEGTEPWAVWLTRSVYTRLIAKMGFPDYEATHEDTVDVDPVKQAQVDASDVNVGIRTRNEVREDRGLDPRNEDEADELTITTAQGAVPLAVDSQIDQKKSKIEAGVEQDPTEPPEPVGSSNGNGKKPSNGTQPKKKAQVLKAIAIEPDKRNPTTIHAKLRIENACKKVFRRQRDRAILEVKRLMKVAAGFWKAEESESQQTSELIYEALATYWYELPAEVAPALEQSMRSGIADGIIQLEISDGDMIQAANEVAQEYARNRAAELVGLRRDEDGQLVPNPSAKWAISETTRDDLRDIITNAFSKETPLDELVQRIAEAGTFSDSRAEMIARTEVAHAQVGGNWHVWKTSGLIKSTKWLISADHKIEDECDLNANETVDFGSEFPSGHVHPPAHPNCLCSIVASKIDS